MTEQYGNVRLDLSKWNGYNTPDGDIDSELLGRMEAGEDPLQILAGDTRYPVLYHFSPERRNILDWYPFCSDMSVLEVGAGMGALTGMLCEKCGTVTALDSSLVRSRVNAVRHRDKDNLSVCACSLQDFEPGCKFDAIVLIEELKYADLYFKGGSPMLDMLQYLKNLLKEQGVLLAAIENRYGVKYFSGAREEHDGLLFSRLEGYPDRHSARTFGKKTIEKLFASAGFARAEFYYPYPDHKMPSSIFSDYGQEFYAYLFEDFQNYGEYLYKALNEANVLAGAAEDGLFPLLSNSFLVEARLREANGRPRMLYAKISSQRNPRYSIRTEIWNMGGKRKVRKIALNEETTENLRAIKKRNDEFFSGFKQFCYPEMEPVPSGLEIEYLRGVSYSDKLVNACDRNDCGLYFEIWEKYKQIISTFVREDIDTGQCGMKEATFLTGYRGALVYPALIELLPGNIMEADGKTYIIDQEWAFDMPIPVTYLVWRAVVSQYDKYSNRIPFSQSGLFERLGLSADDIILSKKLNDVFNREIYGPFSMSEIKQKYAKPVPDLHSIIGRYGTLFISHLYIDEGQGFNSDAVVAADFTAGIGSYNMEFNVAKYRNIRNLRFDPVEGHWCELTVQDITYSTGYGDVKGKTKGLESNAWTQQGSRYHFESFDPWIALHDVPEGTIKVRISGTILMFNDSFMESRMNYFRSLAKRTGMKERAVRLRKAILRNTEKNKASVGERQGDNK